MSGCREIIRDSCWDGFSRDKGILMSMCLRCWDKGVVSLIGYHWVEGGDLPEEAPVPLCGCSRPVDDDHVRVVGEYLNNITGLCPFVRFQGV